MMSEIALKLQVLIFLPLITKIFGAINYGIWAQVVVIQSFANPLVIMGLDAASTRFVSGYSKEKIAQSFTTILLYLITASCFFGIVIILLAPRIAETFFGGRENTKFVMLCAPAILIGVLLSMTGRYFKIINQAKLFSAKQIGESFFPIMISVAVLLLGLSLFNLIGAVILSKLIVTVLFIFLLIKLIGLKPPDFKILLRYLRFGVAIMPAGYAMWILNVSDRLFISKMAGMKALGVYSAVYSLGYMLIPLCVTPFKAMYPPRAAEFYNKNDIDSLVNLFKITTRIITFFIIPSIVGLSLLGESFIKILTTPEFAYAGNLIFYVALGYMFHVMSSFFSINLGLANKPFYSTITIYTCAALNLVLNYFFISSYGIKGAALATCISFGIQFILEFYFSQKISKIRLKYDFISLLKTIIATSIMALFILLIGRNYIDNLFSLVIILLVSACIYFISQYLLKFFSYDEVLAISDIVNLKTLSKTRFFKFFTSFLK